MDDTVATISETVSFFLSILTYTNYPCIKLHSGFYSLCLKYQSKDAKRLMCDGKSNRPFVIQVVPMLVATL